MLDLLWEISLGVGILLVVLSVFLYVKWGILNLSNEISGKKAKKQIEKLKKLNAMSGILETNSDLLTTKASILEIDTGFGVLDKEDIIEGNSIQNLAMKNEEEKTNLLSNEELSLAIDEHGVSGIIEDEWSGERSKSDDGETQLLDEVGTELLEEEEGTQLLEEEGTQLLEEEGTELLEEKLNIVVLEELCSC